MTEFSAILSEVDLLIAIGLFTAGIAAFVLSTISGGGGALVLIPLLNWLIDAANTAPVLNLGTLIGRPSRLILFWKHINWTIVLYYAPFALIGSWLAGWIFSEVRIEWLQIFIGLFLISTVFQFRFGKKKQSFPMKNAYFMPLGLIISALGTIVGALGPVLNPFYLNLEIHKEEMIATKTANSFFMGLAQIGSYTFFDLLSGPYWIYGLCLGLGATLGNIIGKKYLSNISDLSFRRWVIALMVVSGVVLIVKQII